MRRSLGESFSDIYVLDLHGSSTKKEVAPGGSCDQNVFDIRQGVAIGLFVKPSRKTGPARIHHADLWGSRQSKLATLSASDVTTTDWQRLEPAGPYFFVPRSDGATREYQRYPRLDQIFRHYISGVQTKRDVLLTAMTPDELAEKVRKLLASSTGDQVLKSPLGISSADGALAKRSATATFSQQHIRRYMMAPLDIRWVYYDRRLLGRARWSVMRHMLAENLGLVFMRQCTGQGQYDHFLVTRELVSDRVFYSAHGAPFLAPLYLYSSPEQNAVKSPENVAQAFQPEIISGQAGKPDVLLREPNVHREPIAELAAGLQLKFIPDGIGDLRGTFGPEDLLHYMYAVFYSPSYRSRYAEQLRIDFPRVPLTRNLPLFRQLCGLGKQLVQLHLLEASVPPPFANCGATIADADACLSDLPADVRSFHIGGYAVVQRWLQARRHQPLGNEQLAQYQTLVFVARETMRLMNEIDQRIPNWPLL
jgi:predicted helicase